MVARKTAFHLSRSRSARQLGQRFNGYVRPRRFAVLRDDSWLAEELLSAYALARNYAWANRGAVAVALAGAVRGTFGDVSVRLVADTDHESISRERGLWMHRHNCAALVPGEDLPASSRFASTGVPVLLSGTDHTSTYVCRPGPRAADALFSVDHGSGKTEDAVGRPATDDGRPPVVRHRFDGRREQVGRGDDAGIEAVLGTLVKNGVVVPVARLSPVAVIKE
jgi:RNA-splicing ligase RtcB